MLNVQNRSDAIMIGASGTISESLSQYLSNIPAKHEVKEPQKTATFATAHKQPEVLMCRT